MKRSAPFYVLVLIVLMIFGWGVSNYEAPTPPSPMPEIQNSPTAGATQQSTYYVSVEGNDANPGTAALPYKTIQKAINSVPSGSTILVKSGIYNERPIVLASKDNLTIRSETPLGAIVSRGFIISRNTGTVIDGFEMSATSTNYIDGFGIWVQGTNCVIKNNFIHDTAWGGIIMLYYTRSCTVANNKLAGNISLVGIDVRGNQHTITNNEISDVRQFSPYLQNHPSYADADGIHFHGDGHVISGNYIHNMPYGTYTTTSHTDCLQTFDGKTEQPASTNTIVENNLCENIGAVSNEILTKGMQVQSATNLVVRNNTFCAAVGLRIATNSTVTISNNILCGDATLPAAIVSDCMQFESSAGIVTGNRCENFSSWAVRLDNSPSITGSANVVVNTKIRTGTEGLFKLTVVTATTPTPSLLPATITQTPTFTKTATASPTRTPTSTFTHTPTFTQTVKVGTPTFTSSPTVPPTLVGTPTCATTSLPVLIGDQHVGDYCP